MASHFINDPAHWRQRAGEMLALADEISDAETKRTMLKIAKDYEQLAERAQQRSSGG